MLGARGEKSTHFSNSLLAATRPGAVLDAGGIMADGTQFYRSGTYSLGLSCYRISRRGSKRQRLEGVNLRRPRRRSGEKTPLGPEKQSELRGRTWCPPELEVSTVVPAELRW